jgi:hypothetical protein
LQVRKDLEEIAAGISAIPGLKTLAMTTNGILLPRKLPGTTIQTVLNSLVKHFIKQE